MAESSAESPPPLPESITIVWRLAQVAPRSSTMIPTLIGRWQTRLLLTVTLGFPMAVIFGAFTHHSAVDLLAVGLMLVFGLCWDCLYHFWQHQRWEADWPPLYILLT